MDAVYPAGHWTYSHDRQVQINPSEHPDLAVALTRLWGSEVGNNCVAIAMQYGVGQSLRTAMGATLAYVITNDEAAFERYHRDPNSDESDLIISDASPTELSTLAETMERLRQP